MQIEISPDEVRALRFVIAQHVGRYGDVIVDTARDRATRLQPISERLREVLQAASLSS